MVVVAAWRAGLAAEMGVVMMVLSATASVSVVTPLLSCGVCVGDWFRC